jgi:hypothetical protein
LHRYLLWTDWQRLGKKSLDGLVDGGQDLLEDSAAQVADMTLQRTLHEGAKQLPQSGGIGEGLELPGVPIPDFAVTESSLGQPRLKQEQLAQCGQTNRGIGQLVTSTLFLQEAQVLFDFLEVDFDGPTQRVDFQDVLLAEFRLGA